MKRNSRGSARPQERGFALLVIFLIAAAVAFTMYQELPRAAFESARDKEQLLMDRGNQYKRAIQVYYIENKRYPAELKDLESTNNKRYLRRRYIDPMTGDDEWRLIHTNGSFLTDSLVQKPPAQNAGNGLPGAGQTPGGGPLGSNNLNTAPAVASAPNSSADPAGIAGVPAALNAAAQRRPSDRGFPTGPGFPQPPVSDPNNPNGAGPNPLGASPAAVFDPSDPRTWPPITIAAPTAQSGQPPQQGAGGALPSAQPAGAQATGGRPLFGAATPGAAGLPVPGQPLNAQFGTAQPQPQVGPGQLGGMGGANFQPSSPINPNPLGGNGLGGTDIQNGAGQNGAGQIGTGQLGAGQNADQLFIQPGAQTPPGNQPAMVQQGSPPSNGGPPPFNGQANSIPTNASQAANLALGGFNPQTPVSAQSPGASGAQPNPALPNNTAGNAALNAIDNSLFRPNQAPATGPTGSPGIAGVASKFKGPSIKAYKERTKYQEWEFVYEPATNQPGQAGTPGQNALQNQNGLGQGPNGLGQGAPGQNGPGQGSGQTGTTPSNPFSTPNPFTPQSAPTH